MSSIAIFGGHGKVALQLARVLTAAGHEVTSFVRNSDQHDDVAGTGATPALLDIERADTAQLAEAIKGMDAVVFSAGAGGGSPERTYAVDRDAAIRSMDAAGVAGVPRYLMVSYLGARADHGIPPDNGFYPYAEAKAAADTYLRSTGLSWTILAPGTLTLEPGSGRIQLNPDTSGAGTETSRENVAAVAAAVLGRPGAAERTISFIDGDVPIDAALTEAEGPSDTAEARSGTATVDGHSGTAGPG
ncbi:SDR family oxidoreductase [Paenarthrobacter sp. Z7-10]|uniref:SDR family oxidoreductase n=1 Tax=Paenarthrobacter sp. Z7-10 TaxID=2787635 RepID=UPI0022A93D07|nr:SDR family oxidoreductase [Paenarthrobacter sp. Z7-10]MCZ2402145.1 SDR family oxidoreductase [Paenarthrobacter sp. Z7-10]